MQEFAKVAPQFWTGRTGKLIRQLGRDCQVTAAYLITCPSASALGLYYLPIPTLSHETGISPARGFEGPSKPLRSGVLPLRRPRLSFGSRWPPIWKRAIFGTKTRVKWIKRELETLIKSPFFNDFLNLYRDDFHLHDVSPSKRPSDTLRSQETETENTKSTRSQTRSKRPDFETCFKSEFIPAYPEHRRLQEKTALAGLRKLRFDPAARAAIMVRLQTWKASDDWTKDAGKYVPGMGIFFADGWFEREPQALSRNGKAPAAIPPTADEFYGGGAHERR